MKGIFGNLFDFNRDGKMSPLETAMELALLAEMMKEDSEDENSDEEEEE